MENFVLLAFLRSLPYSEGASRHEKKRDRVQSPPFVPIVAWCKVHFIHIVTVTLVLSSPVRCLIETIW